ncbi:hypothetical protein JL721_2591 [Aureococcus anophagefferens]|nr:hypothetical protein JL721_2591 [Aureococcus anophagefferens]
MSDDEARTDTVDLLHSYPHHQPKTGSDFIESEYYTSLIYLAAIVGGIGVILLVVHALYRICLACRSCCCRRCCCTCVERWTKGRRGRMRLLLGFTLLGVCGGVLSWKAAEVELQRGVSNVADSLDTLQDFLGHLGDVTADMLKSTGKITEAASSIECSGSELDDYLDDVSYVNASVADVAAIFDDMIDPVDTAEDQVRSNGRRYVRLVVPVALAAPFALYVLFALCGVGVSKASRAPVSASCCMNTGAIWAGAVGLPVALVVLVVLLVLSVAFSDFCYTDVTSLDDAVESLATYADELEATGVCTGVADALDAIEAATEDLQASVDEITEDVLSCAYIQPIVEDLFYKALCDRTVEGLYRMWILLATCGVAAYCGLILIPWTTAALGQDADTAPETGVELAEKGGDDVDVDEEAKAVDADVYAEAPSPKKKARDDGAAPVEAVLVPAGDSFTYEAI